MRAALRWLMRVVDLILAARAGIGEASVSLENTILRDQLAAEIGHSRALQADLKVAQRENELLATMVDEYKTRVEAVTADHARTIAGVKE